MAGKEVYRYATKQLAESARAALADAGLSVDDVDQFLFHQANLLWDGLQENLKRLSTRSRRIIARHSGHYIQWDRPDLLNREVPAFILHIRDGVAAPDNGSTRTE